MLDEKEAAQRGNGEWKEEKSVVREEGGSQKGGG